jgi:hypothetical protein
MLTYAAEDNASAHGTKCNGSALKAHDKVKLRDGDVLQAIIL